MKNALIDASSAILLHKANLFLEIAHAYHLFMVPTVYKEITVGDRSGADVFRSAGEAGTIRLLPPSAPPKIDPAMESLHAGEWETIAAYDEQDAHFIIMDDGRGARTCRTKKIPYINALLCPHILYLSGIIDNSTRRSAFTQLREIGRYAGEVVSYAKRSTRGVLEPFLP